LTAASSIISDDRLEVPLKYECALPIDKQSPARPHDSAEAVSHESRMLSKILSRDWNFAQRARMISWTREAGKGLQQDFELEEALNFVIEDEVRQPSLARLRILSA
jgi:hypothetical protein